jgi:biofilm PGA synthesis N-glycosyltransferase PgaC
MRIAALIPVYRHPRRLVQIARALASEDFPGARVLVAVDGETNAEILSALDAIRDLPCVDILDGRPHLGKAETLNRAVRETEVDLLLFLDNDIDIRTGTPLFALSTRLLADRDLAELPKVGLGGGAVAAMGRYEFLANLIATEYLVGKAGRFPSINGAAFVMRRELFLRLGCFRPVMNEDMDLAARAYLAGARFGFDPAMTVGNEVPETLEDWFKQRRRWAVNSALWSTVYVERVLRRYPKLGPFLGFSGLLFPLPFLAILAGAILGGSLLAGAALLPPGLGEASAPTRLLGSLLGALVCLAPVARYFSRQARRFGTRFRIGSFLVFSALYLPLWGLASLTGMISISLGKLPELDWKHGGGGQTLPPGAKGPGEEWKAEGQGPN